MHGAKIHQPASGPGLGPGAGWLWLLAGTGDGPPLAAALLQQGWSLQVSVVSEAAARAYRPHPRLRLTTGPLAGPAAIAAELQRRAYAAVVDATHPFAVRISADLAAACRSRGQHLLRLHREVPAGPGVTLLAGLEELGQRTLVGQRLLLAIGMRQLGAAVALSPGALHHARLLPTAASLQAAQAAGLPAERVACVRPSRSGWIEAALLRHWDITTVLARQGGGASEAVWQGLCRELGLSLLLIQRPAAVALPLDQLLQQLAALARNPLLPWTP